MSVKCILTGQTPSVLDGVTENVQTQLNDKVDKVTGKGLSTNDYTSAEKTKLSGIETGAQKNTITGVKGSAETTFRTGNVNITATNIGLGNVNNTSDAEKPISTATQTALNGKQATITGAATTITDNNLTANRALISNSSGKVKVSAVTSTELGYLDGVTSNIQTQLNSKLSSAPVTSVNNKTGAVTLAKGDVGLGNVDNTSDANKPISNATQAALNDKQSKITANGILKGDGSGNITAASETEVELVSLPNICNPNLLDNWYFGNPVNQRGQTSYTGAGYTIDRWKLFVSGSVAITDGGLQFSSAVNFAQVLEGSRVPNGIKATASILTDEGLAAVTFSLSGEAQQIFSAIVGGTALYFTGNWNGAGIHLIMVDGSELVKAVKLELGSQQTLAHQENGKWVLNEIPDYGEQLRRCQRYCVKLGGVYRDRSCQVTSGFLDFPVPLPVTMRAIPSIIGSSVVYSYPNMSKQNGFTVEVLGQIHINPLTSGVVVRATKSNHGLTDAILSFTSPAFLSADL